MTMLEEVWLLFQHGGVVLVAIMLLSVSGWFIGLRALSTLRLLPERTEDGVRVVLGRIEVSFHIVGAFASVAPLLGLLGTVRGMMSAFGAIETFGILDASLISAGISEALITTEAGLIVALPLMIISFYGAHRLERLRHRIKDLKSAQA